jgi:hypothetical protein
MTLAAELTRFAGNSRVYCHALAGFGDTGELMAQYEWLSQFVIADARFSEPVQVGAAQAHCCDMH